MVTIFYIPFKKFLPIPSPQKYSPKFYSETCRSIRSLIHLGLGSVYDIRQKIRIFLHSRYQLMQHHVWKRPCFSTAVSVTCVINTWQMWPRRRMSISFVLSQCLTRHWAGPPRLSLDNQRPLSSSPGLWPHSSLLSWPHCTLQSHHKIDEFCYADLFTALW